MAVWAICDQHEHFVVNVQIDETELGSSFYRVDTFDESRPVRQIEYAFNFLIDEGTNSINATQ